MSEIIIKLEGLEKYQGKLEEIKKRLPEYMQSAGREAAESVVLDTQGVRKYPPILGQWRPPHYPWYERGKGSWTSKDNNTGSSEKYGSQWYVNTEDYGVRIGNRASYAKWLTGKEQSTMSSIFKWRKIADVAEEKKPQIKQVFLNWLNKLLHDVGLK